MSIIDVSVGSIGESTHQTQAVKMLPYILVAAFALTLCYRNYGIRLSFGKEGLVLCTGFCHLHMGLEQGTLLIRLSLLGAGLSPAAKPSQPTMPYKNWKASRATGSPRRGQTTGFRRGGGRTHGPRKYGVGPFNG